MSNMSYCRFENTARDLCDCVDAWFEKDDADLSRSELRGKRAILLQAQELFSIIGIEYDSTDFQVALDDINRSIAALSSNPSDTE